MPTYLLASLNNDREECITIVRNVWEGREWRGASWIGELPQSGTGCSLQKPRPRADFLPWGGAWVRTRAYQALNFQTSCSPEPPAQERKIKKTQKGEGRGTLNRWEFFNRWGSVPPSLPPKALKSECDWYLPWINVTPVFGQVSQMQSLSQGFRCLGLMQGRVCFRKPL